MKKIALIGTITIIAILLFSISSFATNNNNNNMASDAANGMRNVMDGAGNVMEDAASSISNGVRNGVSAVKNTLNGGMTSDTDDNFAAAIKYDGKMSVIEGTWTTPRAVIPSGPMVLCKEGVVVCTGGAENEPDVKVYDIYGNEVEIPGYEMSQDFKNMPWHYAAHINENKPIHDMLTFDTNVEIMAILDAAVKSSKSGKEEKIGE